MNFTYNVRTHEGVLDGKTYGENTLCCINIMDFSLGRGISEALDGLVNLKCFLNTGSQQSVRHWSFDKNRELLGRRFWVCCWS